MEEMLHDAGLPEFQECTRILHWQSADKLVLHVILTSEWIARTGEIQNASGAQDLFALY
jgi:hypothetical protein